MGFVAVLILGAALVWLWRRADALDRKVASLERIERRLEAIERDLARSRTDWKPGERSETVDAGPAAPATLVAAAIATPVAKAAPAIAPPPEPVEPPRRAFRFDFEDLFGRLLPVWAGGVTLAVAGFFLVRWSIERGLLTPSVRVLLAGLFGVALVAGAELAYRWRARVADPRVAQALAGAGLATLYAAFYLAGSTYGLIAPAFAFVGLAAVTAAAIGLSFRFGLPSAVLGLVGGFAAPALVGSEQANLPLLTLYLALVVAGLTFTGRRQRRGWLGLAALAGGLGWGGLLVAQGPNAAPDAAVLGAYLVLLGGIMPAMIGGLGESGRWLRIGATGLAAMQLASLVSLGGFGVLEWGLYLLLGAALAWFGWREAAMREASAVAAAVGIVLLPFWPVPDLAGFALVEAGLAAIFAGVPLARLQRGTGRALDVAQACAVALGLAGALFWHFATPIPDDPEPVHALALAAMGALAALAAWWGRGIPRWTIAAEAVAALLGFAALAQLIPEDALAWIAALLALAAAMRAQALTGALAMLVVFALAWGIEPALGWLGAGADALTGTPMALTGLPGLRTVLLQLFPGIAAALAWRVLAPPAPALRRTLEIVVLAGATIAAHSLYRHAFADVAGGDFVATGVIERALWEAALVAAGWLALVRGQRAIAAALAALAFLHFAWFALVLHDPLWSAQAVGPMPLANALVAMYGAGFAALWLVGRVLPDEPAWVRWGHHALVVIACVLLAMSELRQVFAGSLLAAKSVAQAEDLLRSITGIVLAVGFLLWGARTGARSWRIASLALMVAAVLKVFLVDAAGLEGLARIASFMALGFSLIGIGWFYNRQLREPAGELAAPAP